VRVKERQIGENSENAGDRKRKKETDKKLAGTETYSNTKSRKILNA